VTGIGRIFRLHPPGEQIFLGGLTKLNDLRRHSCFRFHDGESRVSTMTFRSS
jgi:hypothetical protein